MKDLNGNDPELFLCDSNRTAGKTTYFSRLLINRFIKKKSKFGLLYRFQYETDDAAEKFFKDAQKLFFPTYTLTSERRAKGIYQELFLNDEPCGYAISLNSAEQIKKYSHLFSDIDTLYFDEFQSEINRYCPDEIRKFLSVHTSIARGNGQMVRHVPVIMCANCVSLLNPYYAELGIASRLKEETKFLRGNGFVLEHHFNPTAADAQLNSGVNQAFANNSYIAYAAQNVYLHDNQTFIEKVEGRGKYLATLKFNGKLYGLWQYTNQGIVYISNRGDATFPIKLAVTTDDGAINYVLTRQYAGFIGTLRYYFDHGCFRFQDIECKEVLFKLLSY